MIRPRIKGFYDVIPVADGQYQLRSSETTKILKGAAVLQVFSKLLSLLDGRHTTDDIIKELDSVINTNLIEAVIKKLHDAGIIEDAEQEITSGLTAQELEQFRPQVNFFNATLEGSASILDREETSAIADQKRLKETHFLIFGGGMLATSLALQAARSGIGNIFGASIQHSPSLALIDSMVAFEAADIPQDDLKRLEQLLDDKKPALVAVALDQPDPGVMEWVNESSQSRGIPFIHCQTHGTEGVIGPFVVPGETACYTCYRMRIDSQMEFYEEYCAWKEWVKTNGKHQRAQAVGLFAFTEMTAAMAAIEIIKYITEIYEPATYNKFISINALSLDVIHHQVLKLPRCPSCGGARHRVPLPIWQETQ